MSKIKISGFITSKNGDNIHINTDAIKRENSIIYVHDAIKTTVLFAENKITIKRENNDLYNIFEFVQGEETNSKYYINSINKYFNIKIYTKIIHISNNSLNIKYDLYVENEKQDELTFNLNWR